ncbi:MAG TPA: hypothetical protein VFU07_09680 [Candidatus Lumbricidophila sp.]|nr:hypothetical protein [Candidatus Lumbricidophila sp.]
MTDRAWFGASEDAPAEVERLVGAWVDAPTGNLETLDMLLEVARDQVWAYAPESTDDDGAPVDVPAEVPARLVLAQLSQVKNLWNAGRVNSDGDTGDGGYSFTPRPLDKVVRGMIRHTVGAPDV